MWKHTESTVLFCKDCLNKRFDELKNDYDSGKIALMLCCYVLDIPFYEPIYENMIAKSSTINIGVYTRQLQLGQYKNKTFLNTLVDDVFIDPRDIVKEEKEVKWTKADKQNMNFAISIVGYDPFVDCCMSDIDRRYCFNILAGYCDAEGIQEDGHKVQSVIQITQSQIQCKKIDEFINQELLNIKPDEMKIKSLTATKKQLLDSIAKIAQDNNLSSAYNSSSKQGVNTLTSKMREMLQNGFDDIGVNLFNIKTAEAMKQIADLSNKSIMEQLSFESNDYVEMIKEQREMILDYEENNMKLEEENRLLKNELTTLKSKKK
ncbi:MAG: hypothetical protein WCS51_05025 [Bacilli bacterium]